MYLVVSFLGGELRLQDLGFSPWGLELSRASQVGLRAFLFKSPLGLAKTS